MNIHCLQRNWNVLCTNWMCALKRLFSVKAFSNWVQWNVIPNCVILIWSFKWFFIEELYLHLSHFSIPSCAGKDLECPARNPYHSPQTLQSFSAINLNVHKPFFWNLYFNVVLHLIFSGILMPNISSSWSSDLRTVSIIF